jgi:hypothetical protein
MKNTPEEEVSAEDKRRIKLAVRTGLMAGILMIAIGVPQIVTVVADQADFTSSIDQYGAKSTNHAKLANYFNFCKTNVGFLQKVPSDERCLIQAQDASQFDDISKEERTPLILELKKVADDIGLRKKRGFIEKIMKIETV